jgi:hypothetical protein
MADPSRLWLSAALAAGALCVAAGTARAEERELVLGLLCDRTGAKDGD